MKLSDGMYLDLAKASSAQPAECWSSAKNENVPSLAVYLRGVCHNVVGEKDIALVTALYDALCRARGLFCNTAEPSFGSEWYFFREGISALWAAVKVEGGFALWPAVPTGIPLTLFRRGLSSPMFGPVVADDAVLSRALRDPRWRVTEKDAHILNEKIPCDVREHDRSRYDG